MGKTTLMIKLLTFKWMDLFDKVFIFCPTYAEDKNWSVIDEYRNMGKVEIFEDFDEKILMKKWKWAKKQKINDPSFHCLFYFDDCGGEKGFKVNSPDALLNKFIIKCNHANCSVIWVIQTWVAASTTMRKNAEAFVIFYPANEDEKNYMYKEFGRGKKKDFVDFIEKCTEEPYDTLFVNRQGPGAYDFYHNFKKINYIPTYLLGIFLNYLGTSLVILLSLGIY
jgi:hypothetical protein